MIFVAHIRMLSYRYVFRHHNYIHYISLFTPIKSKVITLAIQLKGECSNRIILNENYLIRIVAKKKGKISSKFEKQHNSGLRRSARHWDSLQVL